MQHESACSAAAVAAVWATGAQSAAPPSSENFYVSGASAARAVTPAVANDVCVAGTIARYEYSVTPTDYNLTVCTLRTHASNADIPVELENDTVAIYGRAGGGSLFGLKPILVPQPIRFLDPSTCATNDGVDSTIQQCTGLLGTDYSSGTTPDAGLTDEDPQFLGNVAAEVDSSQPDPLTVAERNVLNGVTPSGFTTIGTYDIVLGGPERVHVPADQHLPPGLARRHGRHLHVGRRRDARHGPGASGAQQMAHGTKGLPADQYVRHGRGSRESRPRLQLLRFTRARCRRSTRHPTMAWSRAGRRTTTSC